MTKCPNCFFEYDESKYSHYCGNSSGSNITLTYGSKEYYDSTYKTLSINELTLPIKIKKHSQLAEFKILPNGDWVDLSIVEDVTLKLGECKLLSFGFSAQLPSGFEAHVIPRSSTFKKFGIIQSNSMGLIDNSYCGDNDIWMFPAYALRDTFIQKGERIAQFRIVQKQPSLRFEFVDSLGNKDRNGFGSTG